MARLKRSQNYGVDYGRHPLEKWVRPLLCVGALLFLGVLYGLFSLAIGAFQ